MRRFSVTTFLIFLFLASIPGAMAQPLGTGVQEFNTPVEAPDFALQEFEGSEISLKGLRGKVVLLNFFTTW
jgi:cytochrome oxidase Cu insertion factor (SCO1/SenC/PrrC family)